MKNLAFASLALSLSLALSPLEAKEVGLVEGGLTLHANLETAGADWQREPFVVMTHGTLAHGEMEMLRGLQAALKDRGIGSLSLTLSLGLDQRRGMYDCAQPHRHRHEDALKEIGAWLTWLQSQGVTKPVILLGHSRGGNQVARFAAAHPEAALSHLVLIAPQTWTETGTADDYQQRYGKPLAPLLERAGQMRDAGKADALLEGVDFLYCPATQASAAAILSYYGPDPAMDTPGLLPNIKVPVLVVAGSQDQVVQGLTAKVQPLVDGQQVQLLELDGADHFFRDLYAEDIADAVHALVSGS